MEVTLIGCYVTARHGENTVLCTAQFCQLGNAEVVAIVHSKVLAVLFRVLDDTPCVDIALAVEEDTGWMRLKLLLAMTHYGVSYKNRL